jgi:hypothetical protein
MPTCETGQGSMGYRFYTRTFGSVSNGKTMLTRRATFKLDDRIHRTDGPAVVEYVKHEDGEIEIVTQLYYLNGVPIHDKDLFNKVLNAPLVEVPLYLNQDFIKDLAAARLNGVGPIQVNIRPSKDLNEILSIIGVKNISRKKMRD